MRTIAIINQKGGCGKTTTSINLAACLARLGQKTLLVDMDPQGHCGVGLAVPEEQVERTIFDTLIEESDGRVAKLSEVVWQIASDFDLAPANIRLAAFEQLFAGRTGRETRLTRVLESARSKYAWTIIDCPPSVGLLTFNALQACDEVIVPVETGFFSLHGLSKMLDTLVLMKEKCGKDIAVRILPTLYDTRTKLAREVLSELRAKFKNQLMESTVNFNTKLKEAASYGQPITEYDPASRGYKDFHNLARELMGHRPPEPEPTPTETMSRPAELVHRAKQISKLQSFQFGRNPVPFGNNAVSTDVPAPVAAEPAFTEPAPEPAVEEVPDLHFGTTRLSDLTLGDAHPFRLTTPPISFGGVANISHDLQSPVLLTPAESLSLMGENAGELALAAPTDLADSLSRQAAEVQSFAASTLNLSAEQLNSPATTQEKIDDFYGVKQIGARVIFSTRFDDVANVAVAGDFNNWSGNATPMTPTQNGRFSLDMALAPGRYRYRLVVDGRWITDPNNKYVETNEYGELNNIVEVD